MEHKWNEIKLLYEINHNNPQWPLHESLQFLKPFVNSQNSTKVYSSEGPNQVSTSNDDVDESIIALVQVTPFLYDKSLQEYKDCNKKKKKFQEIALVISTNLNKQMSGEYSPLKFSK